jgi:hypothetical protein
MTEQTSKERLIAVVTLFAVTVGTVGPVGTRPRRGPIHGRRPATVVPAPVGPLTLPALADVFELRHLDALRGPEAIV